MYIHNQGEIVSKHKLHGKDKKKGSQLLIRVDKAERDAFVTLCDQLDTSAAREIRRFMRQLVAAHAGDDPGVGGKTENAVTAFGNGHAPASHDAISRKTDAQVEIRADRTETPKGSVAQIA